jgi:hypothetical protein
VTIVLLIVGRYSELETSGIRTARHSEQTVPICTDFILSRIFNYLIISISSVIIENRSFLNFR